MEMKNYLLGASGGNGRVQPEAPRKICDLYEAHGGRINGIVHNYQNACFDLMCEIYRIVFGATDKKITSDELKKLGFDDSREPDELDFL